MRLAGWHHRCNGYGLGQTSGEVRDRETLSAAVHGVKKKSDIPEEGNGNPFQYYCLEIPMNRGAWQVTVHGFAKNRTQFSD